LQLIQCYCTAFQESSIRSPRHELTHTGIARFGGRSGLTSPYAPYALQTDWCSQPPTHCFYTMHESLHMLASHLNGNVLIHKHDRNEKADIYLNCVYQFSPRLIKPYQLTPLRLALVDNPPESATPQSPIISWNPNFITIFSWSRHLYISRVTLIHSILLQHSFPPQKKTNTQTPWSKSASELYRPSNRRLSAKWLPTFADKGCHVVSVTDPYGRILGFLDRRRYFSIK
jgi:hypothetical protein